MVDVENLLRIDLVKKIDDQLRWHSFLSLSLCKRRWQVAKQRKKEEEAKAKDDGKTLILKKYVEEHLGEKFRHRFVV